MLCINGINKLEVQIKRIEPLGDPCSSISGAHQTNDKYFDLHEAKVNKRVSFEHVKLVHA